MHRIHSLALAAGLVAAVGIGAVAAQEPQPKPTPTPTPQTQPREQATMPDKPTMTNPDAEFAQKAAMGSKHEIDGAKFAVNKIQNADLKALANRLITDHTAAANELETIMKSKKIAMGSPERKDDMARKDETAKPDRPMPDRPATERPAGEKDQPSGESWRSMSGAAFDRAYADHLITEHEKSVTLYETEASSGKDTELKAFATKTLPTIKAHLKAAQDLKAKLGTT